MCIPCKRILKVKASDYLINLSHHNIKDYSIIWDEIQDVQREEDGNARRNRRARAVMLDDISYISGLTTLQTLVNAADLYRTRTEHGESEPARTSPDSQLHTATNKPLQVSST